MMTSCERIDLLCSPAVRGGLVEYVGEYDHESLNHWLKCELGHSEALDQYIPHGGLMSRAIAARQILHVMSGNTPHAAFQGLLRGLLLGSHNLVKLPSSGLPEVTEWYESLPEALRCMIEFVSRVDDEAIESSDAIIVVGGDEAVQAIHARTHPWQTFIAHGRKLSIGVVHEDFEAAAKLAARDVSLHEQHGCLSLHAIYVPEVNLLEFSSHLAEAMAEYSAASPPPQPSLSLAGAIRNLREVSRYRQVALEDGTMLHESADSLDWTVVATPSPTLQASCLGRSVWVKPLPERVEALGNEAKFLSTIAVHPFSQSTAKSLAGWGAHRICPLGMSQQPSLFWHHDGFAPLATLVKWQDLG